MIRPSGLAGLVVAIACGAATGAQAAGGQPAAAAVHAAASGVRPVLGFARAFEAGLGYDARFAAAGHDRDVSRTGVDVARASLLPTLTLSAADGRTIGTREFPNALGQSMSLDVDYRTPQAVLQLRAPLFNYESLSRYRQALAQSGGADSLYVVRRAELLDRLGTAYLQGILADENLRLSQVQADWLEAQRDRAIQRLQRGEGTRIEVAEAGAQLNVARVRLIDAHDQARVARQALARITGVEDAALPRVGDEIEPGPLVPLELSEWQALAARSNPAIRVRELAVEVARVAVDRQFAGHLPRLDAVAAVSRSTNETTATLNQTSHLSSIGLQFNLPLFAGGGVDASVRQARSEQMRAEAELTDERRSVAQETQRFHAAVSQGGERIASFRQAVAASELLLEGMTRGMAAGQRTQSDVLEAGTKLQLSRRDLAQAKIEYLLARMRLMLLSGALADEVAADLDRQIGGR